MSTLGAIAFVIGVGVFGMPFAWILVQSTVAVWASMIDDLRQWFR